MTGIFRLLALGSLLVGLWLAANPSSPFPATVVLDSGRVLNAAPLRYGINIAPIVSFDRGQIVKNILANSANAGMEPFRAQQIWQIQAGAAPLSTTQVNANVNNANYDPVPANYWAGAAITFVRPGAAPEEDVLCSAKVTSNTVAQSLPRGAIFTFAPACQHAPAAGDLFLLDQTFHQTNADWQCKGAGACSANTHDLCEECGLQTLAFDATQGAVTRKLYFDAAPENRFILLRGGAWSYSHWLKLASGAGTIRTTLQRFGGWNCTFTDTPTHTWQRYAHVCTPNESTGPPSAIGVSWSVSPGATIYQDNVSFQQTSDVDPTNTTIFRDAVIATLRRWYGSREGNPPYGPCRYGPQPAASSLADLTRATPFEPSFSAPGETYNSAQGQQMVGLPQFLTMARVLHCLPVLIVPITFRTGDARDLIDYLAGGAETRYGSLRIAQGQTAPWTSIFPEIDLALGNENWNPIFLSYGIGYRKDAPSLYFDYLQRAKTLFQAMRGQPSFAGNLKLVVGVQTANVADAAALALARPDLIEMNGYTQFTVNDYETPEQLWRPALSQSYNMAHDPRNQDGFFQSLAAYSHMHVCGSSGTADCRVMVYEQNMSTDRGSIPQQSLDGFVDGGGSGVMAAQQFLQNLQAGISNQSFYALTGYGVNAGGRFVHLFGATVDMGGATDAVRPSFLGGALANECVIGPMFSAQVQNAPTYLLPANHNGVNAGSYPAEFAYAFQHETERRVCLINVDLQAHAVVLAGPDAPARNAAVTQAQFAPSLSAVNEAADRKVTVDIAPEARVERLEARPFDPRKPILLPANSITVLKYEKRN